MRFLLERYHSPEEFSSYEDMTAELLAYGTGAHHGLFDRVDKRRLSGFAERFAWDEPLYQEASRQFLLQCAGPAELDSLFRQAHEELSSVYGWVNTRGGKSNEELFFYLGLLARLVLSAVIEGDRQDTAQWMAGETSTPFRRPTRPDWAHLLAGMERKLSWFSANSPIDLARREISRLCREAAEKGSGIYRLSVPTGGGKTLSSLRYALAHAARYQKSRIIFTSPLLSILEQDAAVLRRYIEDSFLILEHHSNVVQTPPHDDEHDPHELMAENWNAPVVLTTLVQLLNTLFGGRPPVSAGFRASVAAC